MNESMNEWMYSNTHFYFYFIAFHGFSETYQKQHQIAIRLLLTGFYERSEFPQGKTTKPRGVFDIRISFMHLIYTKRNAVSTRSVYDTARFCLYQGSFFTPRTMKTDAKQ